MKKLLCIDGNSILNRQFYGIRFLSTKDGFPTNAIFGFVNVIIKQLEALEPDFVAIAFDLKAPTFRHKIYGDYKAGRKPSPDDLIKQFPVAKEICRAMGLTVLEMEGYEADDILGTLAEMAKKSDEPTSAYVLTGDRDSLQLISENVKVLLATNTDTLTFDEQAFLDKYGVRADQYVDVKALMGDSSDNIPGVAGIGEKTAFKLIAEQGSLDGVYENIENAGLTNSVKNKLAVGKDSAYLSQTLARINCQVPLGITLDDIANRGINKPEAKSLFVRYELLNAIKKLGLDKEESDASPAAQVEEIGVSIVENTDVSTLGGEIFALSVLDDKVCLSDGEKVYSVTPDTKLQDFLVSRKIICYDCKNLYKTLEKLGILWRNCYFDVMLGAYVDDSSQGSYAFERLCTTYLGETPDENIPECVYVAKMWSVIDERLRKSEQASLLYDIEMPLAAVLCDMENAGFKIDREGIATYGVELDEIAKALEFRIFMAAGEEFNINSPKQLGEVLFDKLMLPAGKKTKTGYSTNAEVLEKLRKYHPIIDDILEYRQMTKLKSTYVDGLL